MSLSTQRDYDRFNQFSPAAINMIITVYEEIIEKNKAQLSVCQSPNYNLYTNVWPREQQAAFHAILIEYLQKDVDYLRGLE